jgi:hypothetical protein
MEVYLLKFLGLEIYIDNTLSWNIHIDTVVNKLTGLSYRSVKLYMSLSLLIMIFLFFISFHVVSWCYFLGTGFQL